tara:strand:- start:14104 stop:14898 length:795 start_codon:yes stop_codon:yes gene_type:complete
MENSFNNRLLNQCNQTNNRLCIGLDIDPDKLPSHISDLKSVESFTKEIIDATIDFCPVYKPNFAFYERFGSKGFALLENIASHIGNRAITIADAKRGDIGNTSKHYADSIFNQFGFDSITISPYMGSDAIIPFIEDETKGAFILCLTSNDSAKDFQFITENHNQLYEIVADKTKALNNNNNLGLVVGATNKEQMLALREKNSLPWLIPGIGVQGGDLETSIKVGNQNGIGIVNVSRSVIYSGNGSINEIYKSALNYTEQIRSFL